MDFKFGALRTVSATIKKVRISLTRMSFRTVQNSQFQAARGISKRLIKTTKTTTAYAVQKNYARLGLTFTQS